MAAHKVPAEENDSAASIHSQDHHHLPLYGQDIGTRIHRCMRSAGKTRFAHKISLCGNLLTAKVRHARFANKEKALQYIRNHSLHILYRNVEIVPFEDKGHLP